MVSRSISGKPTRFVTVGRHIISVWLLVIETRMGSYERQTF